MSRAYIKQLFDAIDGKVKYDQLDKKKRGRKPGYKHSPETKAKIAEKMKNRTKTEEVRDKISKSLVGRPKPEEVKKKISESKTKHRVSDDFLNQYSGRIREKDVPTSTAEWLNRCGYNSDDLLAWLEAHKHELNSSADICTESHLRAFAVKEAVLDQDFNLKEEKIA
jgi:hypothetical protein